MHNKLRVVGLKHFGYIYKVTLYNKIPPNSSRLRIQNLHSYSQLFSLSETFFTVTIYENTLIYLAIGFFSLLQLTQAVNS